MLIVHCNISVFHLQLVDFDMANEFNYKCRFCLSIFDDLNEIVQHLKSSHGVKDNKSKIHCCVNRTSCLSYFFTFSGLRKHVKKCIQMRHDPSEEISSEIVPAKDNLSTEEEHANASINVRF